DSVCPPVQGCYVLALAGDRPPGPLCLVTTAPGGTACLNLVLQNQNPVAGLQTTLQISDLTKPLPGLPLLANHLAAVQPAGRRAPPWLPVSRTSASRTSASRSLVAT